MPQAGQTVWRITTRRFVDTAFSGEGARLYGGRWNRPGQAMVYTAQSRSLALLEMLVQDDPLRARYVLMAAHLPATVIQQQFAVSDLPVAWREHQERETLQALGAQWLRDSSTCVLAVPSAVVHAELNYLINPAHPDFAKISFGEPELLETDLRLLRAQPAQRS
jgi:RES domain-containing protein